MKVDPMEKNLLRVSIVRGQKVMLDADLADIYDVTTKALIRAVKRNFGRFPEDFAFQLNASEAARLRSQSKISSPQRPDCPQPWVFTDRGALMAANVLNSKQAIQVSVHVVRAYVRLRELIATTRGLVNLLDELERRVSYHDQSITGIVKAIRELAMPPELKPKRRIGFISGD